MAKILITRPQEDSQKISSLLTQEGHISFIEPLLNIVPVPYPPPLSFDTLIFTSANGVRYFSPSPQDLQKNCYVVGPATANEARLKGYKKIFSANGNAQDLFYLLSDSPQNFLHPCGLHLSYDFAQLNCQKLIVYQAHEREEFSAHFFSYMNEIDIVTLFSPRTAEIFNKLCAQNKICTSFKNKRVVCLSPAIAKLASNLIEWKEILISEHENQDSLLTLIRTLS